MRGNLSRSIRHTLVVDVRMSVSCSLRRSSRSSQMLIGGLSAPVKRDPAPVVRLNSKLHTRSFNRLVRSCRSPFSPMLLPCPT